jgi:hypothetical protein
MIIRNHPKYDISEEGVVTLISSGRIIEEKRNRSGYKSITIHKKGHKTNLILARLMLETYGPIKHGLSTDWLSVKYLDGNKDNIHISNLEWNESLYLPDIVPGISHPIDTWFPVTGYDNFELNLKDGILFRNTSTGNLYTTFVGNSGYLTVCAPDGKYIHIHRLLAKMFLPHPQDVGHLTVNHRDSDKLNNVLSNLEWVTQSENNYHAVAEGNRVSDRGRRVSMMALDNFIITGYPSIQEAARFLDANPGHVHGLCNRKHHRGFGYKGFLIKYEDDPISWSEMRKDVHKNQEPYRIAVKDMITGDIVVYNSLIQTVIGEYTNPPTIYRLLWSDVLIPWNGKCFQTYKENMIWPNYPPEIVKAYINVRNGSRPLKVIYPDGSTEYIAGVTEWCKTHPEFEAAVATVNRAIIRDGVWRDIKFEFIDLKDYQ